LNYLQFFHPEFSRSIDHSDKERVSEEYYAKTVWKIYLYYINPYTTKVLLLLRNGAVEAGVIVDNKHLNRNVFDSSLTQLDRHVDKRFQWTIKGVWLTGNWHETENGYIKITVGNQDTVLIRKEDKLVDNESIYYELTHDKLHTYLLTILTKAKNFKASGSYCTNGSITNPAINSDGYGQGIVYKNFDYTNQIELT